MTSPDALRAREAPGTPSDPGILYVGGYGRSGSTLLETVLASHPRVLALGEVHFFPRLLADRFAPCSCGEPLDRCPVWGPVRAAYRERMSPQARRHLRDAPLVEGLPHPLARRLERRGGPGVRAFREHVEVLYGALAEAAPAGTRYLVDSSKTNWTSTSRPWLLETMTGRPVRMVHVVRDPRGVMWSLSRRGLNRHLERRGGDPEGAAAEGAAPAGAAPRRLLAPERALLGWKWANRAAERWGRAAGPGRYLRLRYEALAEAPGDVLPRLARFLDLDPAPWAVWGGGAEGASAGIAVETHQIAGNRMRSAGPVRLRRDDAWEADAGPRIRWEARLLAGSDLRRYGYSPGAGASPGTGTGGPA